MVGGGRQADVEGRERRARARRERDRGPGGEPRGERGAQATVNLVPSPVPAFRRESGVRVRIPPGARGMAPGPTPLTDGRRRAYVKLFPSPDPD